MGRGGYREIVMTIYRTSKGKCCNSLWDKEGGVGSKKWENPWTSYASGPWLRLWKSECLLKPEKLYFSSTKTVYDTSKQCVFFLSDTLSDLFFHLDVDQETANKYLEKFPKFTPQLISDLKIQFQTFDLNQDGLIDFHEL